MWSPNPRTAEICTVIGVHFLMAPISFTWTCGNLMTYINSFVRYQCYPSCYDGDPQWILNTYLVLIGLGLFVFNSIRCRIGLRWTCVIAILGHNGAYMMSAWTIQISVIATCLLMGVVMGLAAGLSINIGFMYINIWTPKNSRVYMVTITIMGPMLSIVQNQIITEVVNPRNLKPNAHQGPRVFFSEPQVLERVPIILILLGSMTFVLQLIGCFLVSSPKVDQSYVPKRHDERRMAKLTKIIKKLIQIRKSEERAKLSVEADKNKATLKYVQPLSAVPEDDLNTNDKLTCKSCPNDSTQGSTDRKQEPDRSSQATDSKDVVVDVSQKLDSEKTEEIQAQFTPSQALKTARFWSLWLYGASLGLGMMLMDSFYKQFGLLYIPNDKHLTLLGSSMPALVCVSRILFTVLLKRQPINVYTVLVFSLTLNCLTTTLWYFAARIHEGVYMCLILLMAVSFSFIFFVLANGTLHEFGKDNFATIYSLVYSGLPITAFISVLYLTPFLNAVGWFWLFMSSSFLSFTALTFTFIAKVILPRIT